MKTKATRRPRKYLRNRRRTTDIYKVYRAVTAHDMQRCSGGALAVAPSRIAIRLLDGDRRLHSPLQLPLALAHTENLICNTSKRSDKTIVQQIANLSFGMSVRCQTNLPLLFLPWHVLE
ncbi:hypothetical protein AVEN_228926-1 [Araneus ventricosus]|uniref:Uncharacterized protein n=1 Tax=Araneus ventricosus TaxID=182803 RepID=A0A4Y2H9G3_ARAVE|nr:hypothetical protein AVEN_228926-1 [Araneus ventricosus]